MTIRFTKVVGLATRGRLILLAILFTVASLAGAFVTTNLTNAAVGDISEYSALTPGASPY